MKKVIIGIFLCVAFAQQSQAQANLPTSSAKTPTTSEQELLDLSKAKWQWMSDKQVDTLNGLVANGKWAGPVSTGTFDRPRRSSRRFAVFHSFRFCKSQSLYTTFVDTVRVFLDKI